jgi:chaperonin GroEL
MLGRIKKAVIGKEDTTLVEGAGDKKEIAGRIALIRRQIEESTSDYDREKLQERLAKLAGGVGIIRVGAATEIEMKEKKDRVDDAVHATKAAVEEGIVPGGGVAFLRCLPALEKLATSLSSDEKVGVEIIMKAISWPIRQIAENAGKEGSIIVQKIVSMDTYDGWDAQNDQFGNMLKMGIVDPTKVSRLSIELSASIAALLLTTEAIITDEVDDKPAMPAMPGAEY